MQIKIQWLKTNCLKPVTEWELTNASVSDSHLVISAGGKARCTFSNDTNRGNGLKASKYRKVITHIKTSDIPEIVQRLIIMKIKSVSICK